MLPPRARLSHWRQLLQALGGLRGGAGHGGRAGAPPGGRPAPPARPRRLRLRSPARPRPRAQGASLPPPPRPPGVGAARHGSGRAAPSADRRRRGSRTPRPGASVVLRPRDWAGAYSAPCRNVVGEWRLGLPAPRHRATTASPPTRPSGPSCARPWRADARLRMIGFLHPWVLVGLAAAADPDPPPSPGPARAADRRLPRGPVPDHDDPGASATAEAPEPAAPAAAHAAHRRPGARGGGAHGSAPRGAGPRAERAGADRGQLAQQRRHRRAAPRDSHSSAMRPRGRARSRHAGRRALAHHGRRRAAARRSRDAGVAARRARDVSPRRLDLGAAIALARRGARPASAAGRDRMLSAISRRRAVSPAEPAAPAARGTSRRLRSPPNVGIARLETGAQPWSAEGGRVARHAGWRLGPRGAAHRAARVRRPPRQALARAGSARSPSRSPGCRVGWWTLSAELAPDELRADDQRSGVVRVAPVARVAWDTADRYVAAACEVLAANRRIARGDEVTFGTAGPGQLGGAAAR